MDRIISENEEKDDNYYDGKIDFGGLDYRDCRLNIKYGKLQRVKIKKATPIESIAYSVSKSGEFKLEKLSEKNLLPTNVNYTIKYKRSDNQSVDVYLELSKWRVFKIRWELKEYLIQKEKLHLYLLGAVIIAIGGKVFFYLENIKNIKTNDTIENTSNKKSSSESVDFELDTVKKDTTIKNNKSTTLNKN